VLVAETEVARIGGGLLVLVGVAKGDTRSEASRLASKTLSLRIFDDADGRMNLAVAQSGGAVLCVSQFTLHADVRRGSRPSYEGAAPAEQAEPLYSAFCSAIEDSGVKCERGVFGADMQLELTNDGPVTIILDTEDLARPRRA
jgi:D-tyrosyl-tRNA(Tyr) deacylase